VIGCELDEAVWLLTTRLGGGVRGLIHVTVVIQISSDASLIALAGCSRWLLSLVALAGVLAGARWVFEMFWMRWYWRLCWRSRYSAHHCVLVRVR